MTVNIEICTKVKAVRILAIKSFSKRCRLFDHAVGGDEGGDEGGISSPSAPHLTEAPVQRDI